MTRDEMIARVRQVVIDSDLWFTSVRALTEDEDTLGDLADADVLAAAVVDAIHPDEYEMVPTAWRNTETGELRATWMPAKPQGPWEPVYVKREPAPTEALVADLTPADGLGDWATLERDTFMRPCKCCGQPGHYQRELEAHIAAHGLDGMGVLVENGKIKDGHHRVLAARRLGLTTIPLETSEQAAQRWERDNGKVPWEQRRKGDLLPHEVCCVMIANADGVRFHHWHPEGHACFLSGDAPTDEELGAAVSVSPAMYGIYEPAPTDPFAEWRDHGDPGA